MYKLIACDLDETLLSDDTTVCERNKKAIRKAVNLGVKFVPATGRGFNAIKKTLTEIGLDNKENEYVISFNGGCVSENKDNRVLQFTGLSHPKAEKLYQLGQQFNVCIHVYTQEKVYVYHADQAEIDYLKPRHPYEIIDNQSNLNFLDKQEIAKVLYQNLDQNYLQEVAQKIKAETEDLDVSYSSNRYLEFNPQGVNKGTGLFYLANKLGIKPDETMALGDNFNDLSMIKEAGLGIGMNNTNPAMKEQCDFITDADNNEGGVGEAIERFVLKAANN